MSHLRKSSLRYPKERFLKRKFPYHLLFIIKDIFEQRLLKRHHFAVKVFLYLFMRSPWKIITEVCLNQILIASSFINNDTPNYRFVQTSPNRLNAMKLNK